ncbi:MAG: hypothetical protein MUC87_16265 [Bacteroidia bacterium]|nr:hypothetical protein [Bacteroidia bacterium]
MAGLLFAASCEESVKSCSRNDRLRSNCFIPGLEKLYDTISFGKYRIWLDVEEETSFRDAKDISAWNWEMRNSSELYCLKDDRFYTGTNLCRLQGIISGKNDSLFFQLQNGRVLRFKTQRTHLPSDSLLYAYCGHFPGKRWFVFSTLYFDQDFCELINRNTGQQYILQNLPAVSPNVNWLASGGSAFLRGNRFQLCALSGDTLHTVFDSNRNAIETELNVKWISANAALLEYRDDINRRYARLVIK